MRTFVFISDIPDFVLQPWFGDAKREATAVVRPNRDPRYERLRRLLADHTSGLMLVMHLETKGYGLALYASEAEALEACKTTIIPDPPAAHGEAGKEGGEGRSLPAPTPLRLRIVEKEKPPPVEAVYNPTIVIEGETVQKSDLANTRGLELTYRGRVVPKWCVNTLDKVDCPFGASCHHIHRVAYQKTIRKRPRLAYEGGGVQGSGGLSPEERRAVDALLMNCKLAEERLLQLRSSAIEHLPTAFVSFSIDDLERYLNGGGNNVLSDDSDDLMLREMANRLEEACRHSAPSLLSGGAIFLRFSFPGGAPWDWSLHCDREEGLPRLRKRCPFPPNGAPTPLDRDIFLQRLFYHINQCNAFTSVLEALQVIRYSKRLRCAFEEFKNRNSRALTRADPTSQGNPEVVYLCIRPWLYLPTVGCEVEAFIEENGRRVRGFVQRYGQLRLMQTVGSLPGPHQSTGEGSSTDADLDAALSRFISVGSETDTAAEADLLSETQRFGKCFRRAVEQLRGHLMSLEQSQPSSASEEKREDPSSSTGEGNDCCLHVSPKASWCVQMALVLPPPSSSPAEAAERMASPSVAVLSFKSYLQALEECPMDTYLTRNTTTASSNKGPSAEAEVLWNLKKHMYAPLLPLDVLEKLRA
ncbi:unnamed protein product [Phytomonas sp. EM1]|nr:unnamed protein product [Phytomonas sp. EM1]|eukprot:CCW63383.1 unnamed protein product [Phytomonas sp. isolate EM1]